MSAEQESWVVDYVHRINPLNKLQEAIQHKFAEHQGYLVHNKDEYAEAIHYDIKNLNKRFPKCRPVQIVEVAGDIAQSIWFDDFGYLRMTRITKTWEGRING